jgi:hypothetical protein
MSASDTAVSDTAVSDTPVGDTATIVPPAPAPIADAGASLAPGPPSLSEDVRASLLLLATVAGFALSVVLAVVLLTSPQ